MALRKNKLNSNAGLASASVMGKADLLSRKEAAIKDIEPIPRNLIAFHENNDYRELDSEETIAQLADAIRRQGLLDNLVVVRRPSRISGNEDKRYVLLSGERRLRAIEMLCEQSEEMATKFATVPCNVIHEDFFELPAETKDRLHAAGMNDEDIRGIQELIIIDEANLQRRGGVGDERMQRKAAIRYSNNLIIIYGIDQKEADNITKQISGQNIRTTIRNLKIERDLIAPLKELLDNDLIKKDEAEKYCMFDVSEQEALSAALTGLADVQMLSKGNPSPEFIVARNAFSEALAKRNRIEREKLFLLAQQNTNKIIEEIKNEKRPQVRKNTAARDTREKFSARLATLETRINGLSSKRSIRQMAQLNKSAAENEQSYCDKIDSMIQRLQTLKEKILEEESRL